MKKNNLLLNINSVVILTIFLFFSHCKKPIELITELNKISGVEITKIEPDSTYTETYKIILTQPLDHNKPDGKKFKQQIFLNHRGFNCPTVLVTEGYSTKYNFTKELAPLLQGNEIRVEHRYFGESIPDSIDWKFLNSTQSSADYHRIVKIFKEIYKGKWVSTGWSKGGQTALVFKHDYPTDVDAVVAYDAPINFSQEDPRIDAFFEKVGTEFCRKRIIDFQRLVLKNKKEILPLYEKFTANKNFTFNLIDPLKSLEFCVLEYPFSFWQYFKIDCNEIPVEGDSLQKILNHLTYVVWAGSYSDDAMNSASMYQSTTEFGYYGYVTKNVKDLLSYSSYKNIEFAPQNTDLTFNPERMKKLNDWYHNEGNNILCIYGEQDPWSAPALEPSETTNSITMYAKGENHYTFINTFPDKEKKKIVTVLEEWLDIKTNE